MKFIKCLMDGPASMGKFIKNIKVFFRKLALCYRWSKECLWHIEEYDYSYYFVVSHYFLKQLNNSIKNGYSPNKKRMKEIRICCKILKRLHKDDYEKNMMVVFYKIWGEPYFLKSNNTGNLSGIRYQKEKTMEDSIAITKTLVHINEISVKMYKRDLKIFMKLFYKHHRKWWD